tara:strand:- start:403 stop:885 length:483 start_codon:yes stop_codon:yes gene_type:complete
MEISVTSPKRKKLIIKKTVVDKAVLKKKKRVQKRVSKKVKPIEKAYLEFDTNINAKYMPSIPDKVNINMDIINGLPKIEFDELLVNNATLNNDIDEEDDDDSISPQENNEELDIDTDSLEELTIGGKTYYMDYNKGVIYNKKYNVIGNIDEFGNPDLNLA